MYSIEPGNDGDKTIQTMIDQSDFNLKGFNMIETSGLIKLSLVRTYAKKMDCLSCLGTASCERYD